MPHRFSFSLILLGTATGLWLVPVSGQQNNGAPFSGLDPKALESIQQAAGTVANAVASTSSSLPDKPDADPVESSETQMPASSGPLSPPKGPSFLGTELPFLDPGSEVLSWNGTTWNVTNNRIFAARFEKYLSAPAADSEEDQAYRDTLRQILDALSPHQPQKGDLPKAVALLPIASAYYHDARLCESLSNTIYGVWLARRNVNALKEANAELARQSKRQLWNANLSAKENSLEKPAENLGANRSGQGQNIGSSSPNNNVTNPGSNLGIPDITAPGTQGMVPDQNSFEWTSWTAYHLKKAAEYEQMALRNKLDIAVSEIQQKLEFQGLILQFFMQRRFEHVVIATRLYRQLFTDGDTAMKLDEKSAFYQGFKSSYGMTPTVTTFDALANEAIRDVDEGVQAFEHLVTQQELESATKRLSEAFAVGEYLPRIRTLSRDKKGQVLDFVRHSNQLLSAIDVKNYHLAAELVEKMKGLAKDFDYAKAQGLIDATTMTADMLLNKALLAARSGDEAEMQKHLEQAHALYPTNPQLQKVSDLILQGSDRQSQALNDLDRLLAEENYRAIQKQEARFVAAVGLSDDPQRLEDLMNVRQTLKDLEMRMEKAKALKEAGSPEAAWETLHLSAENFSSDPDFAQLYSQLTVNAAQFVHMIKEAERHLQNEQLGSSLSWYLKARQSYLKSELAAQGIAHIMETFLPASDTASLSAPNTP